ncbi:MAG: PKD domain-containing protein, partial [Bacteroidota bacterium]|nr:PKD domain-containing protein [Bacteroidota bacterium]
CEGEAFTMTVDTALAGWMHWFAGDEVAVKAEGPPYDESHPMWIASGPICGISSAESGARTWTFMNENFMGRGFASATVNVLPGMEAEMTASSDTVYLDSDPEVRFAVTAEGAVSWEWDFGDGETSTDPAPLHRYTRAGTFAVTVTVSNGTCSATARTTVTVLEGTTGIDDTPSPARIALLQNYPNPAAPVTAIPFRLPARMHVRLTITDVLGRRIATVVDAAMDAGSHTVLWESSELETGSYHCILEAGGQRAMRRMTITR